MNGYHWFKYVPLSVLQAVARLVALLIVWLPEVSLVRSIRLNMRLIDSLHADTSNRRVREIVQNQCLSTVESIKSWAMPPQWSIAQIHTVHNEHLLKDALDNPHGMLAIVPHLGTWEIMNAWLNQFGAPTILYKPAKSGKMDEFMLHGRSQLNATLVPTDSSGVKAIFKTLKAGGFSIILPDHVPDPSGGVIVPFFGVETLTSTLASKLASKTKCALVGLACIRREDAQGFDIYCYELTDPDLYARDANVSTAALNTAMQQIIEPHFNHYMWGYRRFKQVPELGNPYRADSDKLEAFIKKQRKSHQPS
ncbi:lysophospholipid acyltransferase family protein [Psychrobacter aestuarii]|uniref:Lysophospholipid acyltransferase family protein n=1 Tax=Psychrobacter aestuarii TaxID=556327 RepID=A0ABN0VYC6_9GAMM|nr:lysophospholipid acyltransferase family protein [Psychrobacter aestuarii]